MFLMMIHYVISMFIHQFCLIFELYKPVSSVHDNHHPSRSNYDSESLYLNPRSSNFQSFNKFTELFDLPDFGTVFESPMSFTDNSNPLHFNLSQASNGNTRTKYDLSCYLISNVTSSSGSLLHADAVKLLKSPLTSSLKLLRLS